MYKKSYLNSKYENLEINFLDINIECSFFQNRVMGLISVLLSYPSSRSKSINVMFIVDPTSSVIFH